MTGGSRTGPVARALRILEVVAERGGASAREIGDATDLPLPTVYRLATELAEADYLVHIRSEGRYELGHQLHQLGLSLHRQVGLSRPVTAEVLRLHEATGFAAYLAILRGAELVIVHVVDSPRCPRLHPLRFGFHEAPHATAFGKIQLAELDPEARAAYLQRHTLRAHTANTITERSALDADVLDVARRQIAWEHEEFLAGSACAAVPIRNADVSLLGAVAVSGTVDRFPGDERRLEAALRGTASRIAASLRGA
jgi:IclR family transcriptional regulator, acetate operon repressor